MDAFYMHHMLIRGCPRAALDQNPSYPIDKVEE
jgi:hypothetical protein